MLVSLLTFTARFRFNFDRQSHMLQVLAFIWTVNTDQAIRRDAFNVLNFYMSYQEKFLVDIYEENSVATPNPTVIQIALIKDLRNETVLNGYLNNIIWAAQYCRFRDEEMIKLEHDLDTMLLWNTFAAWRRNICSGDNSVVSSRALTLTVMTYLE